MGPRSRAWLIAAMSVLGTAGLGATQLPEPLASAVMLLGWSGEDVPNIDVVRSKPSGGTPTVEAWVDFDGNGRAIPVIHVRSDTENYRAATAMDYPALVRLAGILVHERWHITHGRDEAGAYSAQLAIMEYLHAPAVDLTDVRRALQHVMEATRSRKQAQ